MFYRNMLQESNVYTLGFLAEEILVIGNGHGKYDSKTEDKGKQIISLSQLTELETLFLKKVKELFNSSNPVEVTEFQYALYLWKILDKETAEDYVQFLCKTDVNKLKFLCSLAIHWTGTGGQGWSYNPESYSEYFSTGEVMQLISNYDKNKLNAFTELEQIQLSSFFLNYADEPSREVSESVATELVRKWKNQAT